MSKFKFDQSYSSMIGGVRVSDLVHHKLKSIAQQKNVTIQEVVRVFLNAALEDFEKEYPEHFDVGRKP